jgi:curved DNA-binding protein CbpA
MRAGADKKNAYAVLGVSTRATSGEIKAAFRRLVKRYHPDRNPDDTERVPKEMLELVEAYRTLQNPRKRFLAQREAERADGVSGRRVKPKPPSDGQRILRHLLGRRGKAAAGLYENLLRDGKSLREELRHRDYCDCAFLLAEYFQRTKKRRRGAALYEELYICIGPSSSRAYLRDEVEDRLKSLYLHVLPRDDKPKGAVCWYKKGLDGLPMAPAEQAYAWKKIAENQIKMGQVRQAKKSLDKATSLSPHLKGAKKLYTILGGASSP